jgi:hypothetical protein
LFFYEIAALFLAISSEQQTCLHHEINPNQTLHNDQQPVEPSIHTQPVPNIASNSKNKFPLSPLQRE